MSRFDHGHMSDPCAVNVCYIGDKLYALTETVLIRQIDPETLDTVGDKVTGYTVYPNCYYCQIGN